MRRLLEIGLIVFALLGAASGVSACGLGAPPGNSSVTVTPTPTRVALSVPRPAPTSAPPALPAVTIPPSATRSASAARPAALPTPPPRQPTSRPTDQPTSTLTDPVLVGAGDIATCQAASEATAQLIESIPGAVFTLGDNAYPSGTLAQFTLCYHTTWGKFRARTHPVPGNHDYVTTGAKGYFSYFGASAGQATKGYYSYDAGTWHIVALNSEIDSGVSSAQVQWLKQDLAAHPAQCTLAMWHEPLFSSGPHGGDGSGVKTRAFWDVLYEMGADVILNGHDHDYERFAPQQPDGSPDDQRGIREFVAGTGGAPLYPIVKIKPNSEARRAGMFGVLKLTLHATRYDWQFIPTDPALSGDSGSGDCHG